MDGQTELLVPPSPDDTRPLTWCFEVAGVAEPQGSMIPFIAGGHAKVRASNATELRRWRKTVEEQARAALPDWLPEPTNGPVFLKLIFVRERNASDYLTDGRTLRKGAPRFPDTAPDGDKLDRAVWDALTGIAFTNDARVVGWLGLKRFGEPARVIVELTLL